MFIYVSKLFQAFFRTSNALLAVLIIGLVLVWTKRWFNAGRILISLAVLFSVAITFLPIPDMLLKPLEEAIPRAELPLNVKGIITMGGVDPLLSYENKEAALWEDSECLFSAVSLARKYPEAKILFTGGSGSLLYREASEASAAWLFFKEEGIDESRCIWEYESRGTHEKAVNTYKLLKPSPNDLWILITSAFRMPRTMMVFKKAGWNVLPWPVNAQSRRIAYFEPNFDMSLYWLWTASKEWFGLLGYRLTGRVDEIFPSLNK
ncbi:MAG: YdcF family protein [Candidatus Riflebacteria bacterium]|nr:YdcF family protein [Candidatus Riflebacteria bacterium]